MLKNEKESYPRTVIVQVAMFRIDFSYFLTPVNWLKGSFGVKMDLFVRLVALSANYLQLSLEFIHL
jgi:hypothetical protein